MKKILSLLCIITILLETSFVFANEEETETIDYVWINEVIEESKEQDILEILSKNAVVYERNSKQILFGKNENQKVPMASTTKIMTAIVLVEELEKQDISFDTEVIVEKQAAAIQGSRLGLSTGDKVTYNDLLYGLMICSGNDAAVQIAISIGGSIEGFAELMNSKAKKLGLTNTNFVTPHGLDKDNHYTTAYELAVIADYALKKEKIREVVSTQNCNVTINGKTKNISNTNELLGYLEGVNGVKTGFTNKAGRCLVTSVKRDGFEIITVVLGADTKKIRTKDSIKLIEYAYKKYQIINLEEIIEAEFENWNKINSKRININKAKVNNVEIRLGSYLQKEYVVKKEEKDNIWFEANCEYNLEAPVHKNYKIGEMSVNINNAEIQEIDLFINKEIERKNVCDYVVEILEWV